MSAGVARACSNCGDEIVPGDRFCASCGNRVDRACSACGVMLVSGDRFCPECGAPQDPTAPNANPPIGPSPWDAVVRVLRSSLAGEYRITRELGRGGQAAVFQADELALNRIVAIKVLAPGSISGERQVELFRREAQTIANLKHPHIVTIFSVRQLDDLHLFVMQYIEGRSLAAIIADCGPLPLTAVRAVAFQVGSALQCAHRRNVIHRDVKPANVLFDEDGNAILTDFGIAKDTSSHPSSTVTSSMMGTAAYMSPEQCHQSPVTWASDQYSLGILLYEMLTGRLPFEGSSFAIMQGHTDREPPPIRAIRGDCPVELEWAVMRMLDKLPNDRWPSIPDALAALGAGPLSRDDPIRGELKRLARWASPTDAVVPPRVSLRVPERLEVGESLACEAYAISNTDPSPQRLTATWRAANSATACFEAPNGVLLGVAPGRTTVIADTGHGTVDAEVQVVPAAVRDIVFQLARPTLSVGESVRLSADVRDRRGGRLNLPVEWISVDPAVATLATDGTLLAVAPGSTSIVARAGGVSAKRMVFVQGADAVAINILGGRPTIAIGDTLVLSADVFDAHGRRLSSRDVRWELDEQMVASVDRFGVVRPIAVGRVTIAARSGSVEARIVIGVTDPAASASSRSNTPRIDVGPELLTAAEPIGPSNVHDGDTSADVEWRPETDEVVTGYPPNDQAPATSLALVPYRATIGRQVALFFVPVLLVVIVVWRIVSTGLRDGDTMERGDPTSLFGTATMELLNRTGFTLGETVAFDDFRMAPADQGVSVTDGRLAVSGGSVFGVESWRSTALDFAVHVDIDIEPGAERRQGGIVLRADDGRRYFIQLIGPAKRAYGLTLDDSVLSAPLDDPAIRDGNNFVNLLFTDGKLRIVVNDVLLAERSLASPRPDGQVGVYVGTPGGVTFDNLAVTSLKRR